MGDAHFGVHINICCWSDCSSVRWGFSGIAAIGKFVGGAILVIGMLWLFTQPVLLVIVIVLLVVIIACCSGTK